MVKDNKFKTDTMSKKNVPNWQKLKKNEVWFTYNDKSRGAKKLSMVGKTQKMHKDLAQTLVDRGFGSVTDKAPSKVDDTRPGKVTRTKKSTSEAKASED